MGAYRHFQLEGRSTHDFEKQVERCLRAVIWGTKKDKAPNETCWSSGHDLPVFLTGGGANSRRHRAIVDRLGPWLEDYTRNAGIRLLDLPTFRPMDPDGSAADADFSRLAVARGLSYLPTEIGKLVPPSGVGNLPKQKPLDRPEFLSKDQV